MIFQLNSFWIEISRIISKEKRLNFNKFDVRVFVVFTGRWGGRSAPLLLGLLVCLLLLLALGGS